MTDTLIFLDDAPPDTSPPGLADVDHPCDKCGKETGWTGRGRRKKLCDDCRPARSSPGVRVTGNAANQAAQAAKVLANINTFFALGFGGLGFIQTMGVTMEKNEDFERAAYAALVTDPKMCQKILNVGEISAGFTLGLAYVSFGMGIAPVFTAEYKAKKEARRVQMESAE